MEKIIQFLTNNSLVIDGVLAIIITVLGGWTYKYKDLLFTSLRFLADGKLSRDEAHKIVDKYYDAKETKES